MIAWRAFRGEVRGDLVEDLDRIVRLETDYRVGVFFECDGGTPGHSEFAIRDAISEPGVVAERASSFGVCGG